MIFSDIVLKTRADLSSVHPVRNTPCGTAHRRAKARKANRRARHQRRSNR